jgi:hypothetical protein
MPDECLWCHSTALYSVYSLCRGHQLLKAACTVIIGALVFSDKLQMKNKLIIILVITFHNIIQKDDSGSQQISSSIIIIETGLRPDSCIYSTSCSSCFIEIFIAISAGYSLPLNFMLNITMIFQRTDITGYDITILYFDKTLFHDFYLL